MMSTRRNRAAVIALGVCAILVWQLALFRNWAANVGGSTEKFPYGSLCSTTMMPLRIPFRSMPTSMTIGPS